MDADGANETEIPNGGSAEVESRVVAGRKQDPVSTGTATCISMNRDGTGETNITNTPGID